VNDDVDLLDEPPAPPPDNVIQFRRPEDPDAPTQGPPDVIAHAPPGPCAHARIVLDAKLRRVTCRTCGETLDALQCLVNLAAYGEQLARERRWIEQQKATAAARQQRAAARRMFAKQKAAAVVTRANCHGCGGTGWLPNPAGGVTRCPCRTAGERLL